MFQGLQEDQLAGALEAMLFVTDEPVGTIALAEMLECEVGAVEAALVRLRDDLEARGSGIQLREVAGGWRLFTHPAYHELIEKYVLSWDTRKLSAAAMETLAIVAYTQPVTRAGVASVRGVNSDSSINSLVEKGLVREVGTEDAPGNPVQPCRPARFGRLRARCGDASAHHGAVVGHAQGRGCLRRAGPHHGPRAHGGGLRGRRRRGHAI